LYVAIRMLGEKSMDKKWITVFLSILFFIVGFLVLFEQYVNFGIWFQTKDIHHETFALSSFTLAIGILIGLSACKK
jgi:uncharacterized membrane protein HdeD (DUF308 family)